MPFTFHPTEKIPEVVLVKQHKFEDERGFFIETYSQSEFKELGPGLMFRQDNCSFSKKNVLRGLHYQLGEHAQGKLVRVIKGKIWDVALDIRKTSASFGKWVGAELSEGNNSALYIPPGFAHGF